MTSRTMTIIIAATLIALIAFVYLFSVPPRSEKIGPPELDTTAVTIDTASHEMTINK